jgi:hypothetical protein
MGPIEIPTATGDDHQRRTDTRLWRYDRGR